MKKNTLLKAISTSLLVLLALISFLGLVGCAGQTVTTSKEKSYSPFYTDRVVTVTFVMTEDDWAYLQASAIEEAYVPADMWYDGDLISGIAVRPKGNSSLSSTISSGSIKFGLKADLNFFNSARSLDGVKKLNFNNGWSDPTFLREILSYELFEQMGLPTPRASFVDVFVNDTHLGLYTMVEQIDATFLARNFTDTNGNLYKPEMPAGYLNWTEDDVTTTAAGAVDTSKINLGGGNLDDIMAALGQDTSTDEETATIPNNQGGFNFGNMPADNVTPGGMRPGFNPMADNTTNWFRPNMGNLPLGDNISNNFTRGAFRGGMGFAMGGNMGGGFGSSGNYLEQMGLKTNENKPEYAALYRLLDILNNAPDEIFAAEIVNVLDVDQVLRYLAVSSVLVHLDNYTGMGHNYYLYEVDGKFTIIPWDLNMSFGGFNSGLDTDGIINFLVDEPTAGAVADRPLVARLLAVPEYLETYHQYINEMINGCFSSEVMNSRIDALADLIRPYVAADTLKFYTTAAFESYLDAGTESLSSGRMGGMGANIGLKSFIAARLESIRKQLAGELPSTNNGQGNGGSSFGGGGNILNGMNPD